MKNQKLLFLSILLGLGLGACQDHDDHEGHDMPLNISYPAAFVVNGQDNTLSVISLKDNEAKETINLRGAVSPHHISLSPDQKHLAVAITSTDLSAGHVHGAGGSGFKVMVLDAVTGLPEKALELATMPHNAAFNPSGTELWIGQSGENVGSVLVYKTSDWSVKNKITVGKNPSEVTFAADGSKVYVANTGAGTVSVINPGAKGVEATLSVGEAPVGAWPAANGKMYVDNEASQTVSILDVATNTISETLPLGYKPGYVAYQPSTNELWVSDATNGKVIIYERSANAWVKKAEAFTGADAHAIAFNQDNTLAYVSNQGAQNLTVLDAVTYAKIKEITVGKKPNGVVLKQ